VLHYLCETQYFEKIVQLPFTLPPISDKQFGDFLTSVYPDDDIKLCSGIFADGLARNPRKVKRLLQTFLFLRDLASDEIDSDVMKSSLIAKMVIVQSQFRRLYQDIADNPALLPQLEKYFRQSQADPNKPPEITTDPKLKEQVEVSATQYSAVRKVLLRKVSDDDSFVDVDVEPYIFLFKPVVETKPTVEPISPESTISVREDILSAQTRYLAQVISTNQVLSISAVDPSFVSSVRPDIQNLFVPMSFTKAGDGRDSRAVTEQKRFTLEGILQSSIRSIILGSAGSGKTTLLRYLAYLFARALSQSDDAFVKQQFGISENLLPIYIPIREYGRFNEQVKTATPAGFLAFLDEYFNQWNIELPDGFFRSYFERGNCILLLDGLDEVDSSLRDFVAAGIESIIGRYRTIRVIVTSRPYGYYRGLESFAPYNITSFDDEAITRFVQQFYVNATGDQLKARQEAESLISAITRYPELHSLAQNPLILTLMVAVHFSRASLPDSRIELYAATLDLLLERWDATKGIQTEKPGLGITKDLLAALALSAHERSALSLSRSEMERPFVLSVFSNELVKKGLPQVEAEQQSVTLLEILTKRNTVLVEVGVGTGGVNLYSFVHKIFQEYLAAIALAQRPDFADLVLQRYKDVFWEEVILLALARVSGVSRNVAEDVIRALLETHSPEGILLSGRYLVEVGSPGDTLLQKKVIECLRTLVDNTNISDELRTRAKTNLERLGNVE